eukprot:6198374-Pleurochrysis_carterae.AAC.5
MVLRLAELKIRTLGIRSRILGLGGSGDGVLIGDSASVAAWFVLLVLAALAAGLSNRVSGAIHARSGHGPLARAHMFRIPKST